ncbi:MAG: hypothetical protein AMXMBFR83_10820 [Phycisphaerae bacterium]
MILDVRMVLSFEWRNLEPQRILRRRAGAHNEGPAARPTGHKTADPLNSTLR